MNKWIKVPALLTLGTAISLPVSAADIRFNGFASVVGGMTFNEGDVLTSDGPGKATFLADQQSYGVYDDDFSFNPESIYGLQVQADLGEGLSVMAQLTGAGGDDFQTELQWAYVSYEATNSITLAAGRQRIPYYFYSDYLDVAYAYHWIRPPVEVYGQPTNNYEGVQYMQQFSVGSWDGRIQLYTGTASGDAAGGIINFEHEDMLGATAYIANDWLQLRASYLITSIGIEESSFEGEVQGDDNPVDTSFLGVGARAQLGDAFIMAEYAVQEFDDPVLSNIGQGTEGGTNWYVSAGYRFGSVTPHLTYAETESDIVAESSFGGSPLFTEDQTRGNNSVTAGVRWDFHPSATFKAEYRVSTDESTDEYVATWGEGGDLDVVTVGVDVIF